ncbi:MAG: response regulator [Methylovirgula sp.]
MFEEYHQLDNAAREPSRGLGLGLNMCNVLANCSATGSASARKPGKGSVFAVEVALQLNEKAPRLEYRRRIVDVPDVEGVHNVGSVLVVEDDPDMRGLLEHLLKDEGHEITTAADGIAALELTTSGRFRSDVILADYNLPNGMNGLQLAGALRTKFHRETPVIILTGDISTATLRDIAAQGCIQVNKPVKFRELTQLIQRLLLQTAVTPGVRHPIEALPVREHRSFHR